MTFAYGFRLVNTLDHQPPNVLFCGGPRWRFHWHRAGGPSAGTNGSAPTPLCDLSEWDKNLDGLKRHRDRIIVRALNQAKFFQSRNVGVDI
jgi:hypothetical protein